MMSLLLEIVEPDCSEVAVTVTVPFFFGCTIPDPSTVATLLSSTVQDTDFLVAFDGEMVAII